METLVVIAVITVLIVPVILIVAGCKLISAAKEFRKGKETQEKILLTLLKIQSELAAFRKDIGSVPVEKKALEKEIVPQSAGKGNLRKTDCRSSERWKDCFCICLVRAGEEKRSGAEECSVRSRPCFLTGEEAGDNIPSRSRMSRRFGGEARVFTESGSLFRCARVSGL